MRKKGEGADCGVLAAHSKDHTMHIPLTASLHSVHDTTLRIHYLLEDWLAVVSGDGSVTLHVDVCLVFRRT